MYFNILNVNQYYTHYAEVDYIRITFSLIPAELDYIEIGKEYAVASQKKEWMLKEKKFANTNITFYDISTISKNGSEYVKNLLQTSKNLIGIGHFNEESESEFQTYPALLGFEIWLSSKAYNHLFNQLINKNIPSSIDIDIDGLNYGWEPDGSHTIWNIEKYKIEDSLKVSNISINYNLQQSTAIDIEAAETIKEIEQDEKKELIIKSGTQDKQVRPDELKKLMSKIYTILMVIAILLAISIFKH